MKLEIVKGLAVLKATNKKDSEKLMLYYLGKNPAKEEVKAPVERAEPRKYKHSRSFIMKRTMKKVYGKKEKQPCEYGCGSFINLGAHMLQKHGQGKNGPTVPPRNLIKGARGTAKQGDQLPPREYLDISHIGEHSRHTHG